MGYTKKNPPNNKVTEIDCWKIFTHSFLYNYPSHTHLLTNPSLATEPNIEAVTLIDSDLIKATDATPTVSMLGWGGG